MKQLSYDGMESSTIGGLMLLMRESSDICSLELLMRTRGVDWGNRSLCIFCAREVVVYKEVEADVSSLNPTIYLTFHQPHNPGYRLHV